MGIIGGKAIDYSGRIHNTVVRIPDLFTGLFEFSNLGKIFGVHRSHDKFYYKDTDVINLTSDSTVGAVSGAYLLVKKRVFNNLEGFDENIFMYLEDVDLCKRANDLGYKVMFCPHSKISHVSGASSTNKYRINHQAWFESRKYYYKKHFNFLVNFVIQPLYILEEYMLKKYRNI